jgi:hypothetical protein
MRSETITKSLSILALSFAVIAVDADANANASTLLFDDISGSISNGYGGLNWNNMEVVNVTTVPNSGYINSTISGTNVAFNASGNPASIASNTAFDFNSAYLTGAWNDGLSIQVNALLAGVTKYSRTVVVNTTAAQLFNFDFVGIDQLQFSSFGGTRNSTFNGSGNQFAMDNFVFNEPIVSGSTSVPEPFTIIGTIVGGTTAFRMRKKLLKTSSK